MSYVMYWNPSHILSLSIAFQGQYCSVFETYFEGRLFHVALIIKEVCPSSTACLARRSTQDKVVTASS